MGPGTISQQAGIDHTHVPPLGIWAQTNRAKQNIPKRPCTAHQHAQIQSKQARMRAIRLSGNQATWRPPRTRAQPVTLVSFSYGRWFEVSAIQQQQIWLSAQPRRDAMTTTNSHTSKLWRLQKTRPQTTTTKSQHRLTFECFWMLLRKEPNTETQ